MKSRRRLSGAGQEGAGDRGSGGRSVKDVGAGRRGGEGAGWHCVLLGWKLVAKALAFLPWPLSS